MEQVLRGWQLRLQAPRVSERRLTSFARVHLNLPPNHRPERHFFVEMELLRLLSPRNRECLRQFEDYSLWFLAQIWGGGFWLGLRSGLWVLVRVENKVSRWWLRWVAVVEAWVLGLMGFAYRGRRGSWVCGFCSPLYPLPPSLPLTVRLLSLKFSLVCCCCCCCCCFFFFFFFFFFLVAMGLIFGWMLIVVAMGWPWVWVCCWMLMVYGGGGWQWQDVEKKVVERERKW